MAALGLALGVMAFGGCDEVQEVLETDVTGTVTDNRGQPVAGATVKLYNLLDNTNFVEGSDIASAEAFIDREAVLSSSNAMASGQTGADGRFTLGAIPTAFLAVATKDGCSAGFAGFDESTGVLNMDTLIAPSFEDGVSFEIGGFVLACATPPEGEAPQFDPPPRDVTCDAEQCTAAGGTCEANACAVTCGAASCAETGGSCVDGLCVPPACNPDACADLGGACTADSCVLPDTCTATQAACTAAGGTCSADDTSCDIPACTAAEAECTAAGGTCSADGATCELPACSSDADCSVAQPGAYCTNPGDVATAKCEPPLPDEIVPPAAASGWTGFRITDASDAVLADAGADNASIAAAAIPADGIVRVQGDYSGAGSTAFVQVQSGSQTCPELPPRTDFIPVEVVGGKLASEKGNFVELMLHGGYQKVQLTSSDVLGEGDQSFAIEVGDPCAAPKHAFIAILTWTAGPGQPADLDLDVWNASGDLVFVGKKDAAWGKLALEGKGPGPEVFVASDASQGPFTVKVQFFSGKPRDIEAKVRIIRTVAGEVLDETFVSHVGHPKDVAEVGVFPAQ
jgi:hypothetical protein